MTGKTEVIDCCNNKGFKASELKLSPMLLSKLYKWEYSIFTFGDKGHIMQSYSIASTVCKCDRTFSLSYFPLPCKAFDFFEVPRFEEIKIASEWRNICICSCIHNPIIRWRIGN